MPRLTTDSNRAVDLCRSCWPPHERRAQTLYGKFVDYTPAGNEHPDYDDFGDYTCDRCDRRLTARDN